MSLSFVLAASSDVVWAQTLGGLDTFELPAVAPGEGLYYPDLQASFPGVDWQALDRLYIPAGRYKFLRLGNLPVRSAGDPLVITNHGGQVWVGGLDHYYLLSISGGSHWKLTGRFDALAATGDAGFRGHEAGYADSAGTYGIMVNDESIALTRNNSGLSIGGGATQFEVEFVEIARVGFAGLTMKTDDDGEAHMQGVSLHDLYIHDTGSEGFYIGSTQGEPQHRIEGLQLYNNRVVRAGTEALQVGQLGDGCDIHHNVFLLGALDWKNPFQPFQDNNTQFGGRMGTIRIHHNLFLGGASKFLIWFDQVRTGDVHNPSDLFEVSDNFFSHSRHFGVYIQSAGDGTTTFRFARNAFRKIDFHYDELDPAATDYNAVFRIFNTTNPIEIEDNAWDGPQTFIQASGSNLIATGNLSMAVPAPIFMDSGFAADFDYFLVEAWTDVDIDDNPVFYLPGDYVTYDGTLYRSVAATSHTGVLPGSDGSTWEALPLPADDLRSAPDSPWADFGLLDSPAAVVFGDGFESGDTSSWSSGVP